MALDWPTFHGNIERNGSTTASGPTGNTVANQWQLPGFVDSSPAVDTNGIGYVGDTEQSKGKVYALDPAHPDTWKWSFATNGPVDSSPTLSPDGKTLYVGSGDGRLYALDTATGNQEWGANLNGPIHSSPLLTPDGGRIFINNGSGTVFQLKASDGTETGWGHLFFPSIPGSLSLSPDGSTLYLATFNGYMYGVPASGPASGSTTPYYLDGPAVSTPAVDAGGNIYVTTSNGVLESFSAGSSTPRCKFQIPSLAPARSTPAIANGVVIVGDDDQNIYALSQSNCSQVIWQAHTGSPVRSSAAIGSNNLAYIGSEDGNLYAFGLNGTLAWTKATGGAVNSSPGIGSGGTLWVGSDSGAVYRFRDMAPTPTATFTPISTPTSTATPTATPTSATTATATGSPTPTATVTSTNTATPTATVVASASIVLRPDIVTAGASATIRVDGSGFQPNETVWVGYTAILTGGTTAIEQASATAAEGGTFTIPSLPVPANIYPAPHQIKAIGQTSGRTATATLTVLASAPRATTTPTATSTPVAPAKFRISFVRVQKNTKANWNPRAASYSRIRVGQRVSFAIYVQVQSLPSAGTLNFTWCITRSRRMVSHHGKHIELPPGAVGNYWSHWEHRFSAPGPYTLLSSATLNGVRRTKAIAVHVYRAAK